MGSAPGFGSQNASSPNHRHEIAALRVVPSFGPLRCTVRKSNSKASPGSTLNERMLYKSGKSSNAGHSSVKDRIWSATPSELLHLFGRETPRAGYSGKGLIPQVRTLNKFECALSHSHQWRSWMNNEQSTAQYGRSWCHAELPSSALTNTWS